MKIILAILFCAISLYSQDEANWEYLAYTYGGSIVDLAIDRDDLLYAVYLNRMNTDLCYLDTAHTPPPLPKIALTIIHFLYIRQN